MIKNSLASGLLASYQHVKSNGESGMLTVFGQSAVQLAFSPCRSTAVIRYSDAEPLSE